MDGMDCRRGSVRPTWGVVRLSGGGDFAQPYLDCVMSEGMK